MSGQSNEEYRWFCKKCKIGFVGDEGSWVCPKCGSDKDVWDYDDYGDYDNMLLGGGVFNWNKK
jgi:hypothetical protein